MIGSRSNDHSRQRNARDSLLAQSRGGTKEGADETRICCGNRTTGHPCDEMQAVPLCDLRVLSEWNERAGEEASGFRPGDRLDSRCLWVSRGFVDSLGQDVRQAQRPVTRSKRRASLSRDSGEGPRPEGGAILRPALRGSWLREQTSSLGPAQLSGRGDRTARRRNTKKRRPNATERAAAIHVYSPGVRCRCNGAKRSTAEKAGRSFDTVQRPATAASDPR